MISLFLVLCNQRCHLKAKDIRKKFLEGVSVRSEKVKDELVLDGNHNELVSRSWALINQVYILFLYAHVTTQTFPNPAIGLALINCLFICFQLLKNKDIREFFDGMVFMHVSERREQYQRRVEGRG
ncbi:hypothetical protein AAZV13_04G185100 [Glycine max]